jgi:hypothetical protein
VPRRWPPRLAPTFTPSPQAAALNCHTFVTWGFTDSTRGFRNLPGMGEATMLTSYAQRRRTTLNQQLGQG